MQSMRFMAQKGSALVIAEPKQEGDIVHLDRSSQGAVERMG